MSHTTKNKVKTLSRVRRIKGQVEAIERALEGEGECEEILQLVASCRGALNGLILPISLGVMLVASRHRAIVGDYRHSVLLTLGGVIVAASMAAMGVWSLWKQIPLLFR